VLDVGPHDDVAGLPVDGVRDGVNPAGGALGECDLVRLGPDERRDGLARAVERLEGRLVGSSRTGESYSCRWTKASGGVDDVLRTGAVGPEVQVDVVLKRGNVRAEF